ncbi:MAG: hypothetical protein JWM36_2705 [Hyphomicrobiales bacterium]|nr:hypothetical protein [Hyphomicrobiales bacterium]
MTIDDSADLLIHAPGPVRDAFLQQLDRRVDVGVASQKLLALCIKLRRCNDPLPGITCDMLSIPRGSTYGQAAMIVLGSPQAWPER